VLTLRPTSTDLFRGLDGLVDDVAHLPYWSGSRAAFLATFCRFVVTRRFDVSILAYPAARREYQILHAIIRSRRRFAHGYGRSFVLDRMPGFKTTRLDVAGASNVERNAALFRHVDRRHEVAAAYAVPESWLARVALRRRPGYVVIHVGSVDHDSFAAKRWPLDRFIELGRRLVARGEHVVYLSGPDERSETRAAHEATATSELFSGSLLDTAGLLNGAALVLTNDSGVGHLAAGLGRRVVSLFGPTPIEYAPYGATVVAVRPSPCPPCFDVIRSDMSCKLDIDYACLRRDLTVDVVENVAIAQLAQTST